MMDNPAPTDAPLLEVITHRWSPRAFADKPVEADKLTTILEAARWAPSSYNEQPWRFIVATKENPEQYEKLLGCLVEFNQGWAKSAPVLMLSVGSTQFAKNGKPNQHCWHDVGAASAHLCLQAVALGLRTHGMAGFNASQARTAFGIPEHFEPIAAWAIGYPTDDLSSLSDEMQAAEQAPRQRRPLSETVFSGEWGQTSPLAK